MAVESPSPESSDRDAVGADRDRWTRWFETTVTAVTGLTAIVSVSILASALGLT
jgi:hypothetical protein